MSNFSDWLRSVLEIRDASQRKVAGYAGVSSATVHNWLAEKTKPSYQSCVKLAKYLGIPENRVLRLAGYEPKSQEEVDLEDPELDLMFYELRELSQEQREFLKEWLRPLMADWRRSIIPLSASDALTKRC